MIISLKLKVYFFNSDKNIKEFYKSLKELAQEKNELLYIIQHKEKERQRLEAELR